MLGVDKPKKDYYRQLFPAFDLYLSHHYDIRTHGEDNILDRPAIYVANHVRFVDSMLLAAAYTRETKQPLRFVAKQEYFDGKGIDDNGKLGRTAMWLVEHTHMIPVDREGENPRSFINLQNDVADRIAHGSSVALHAEGTRTEDDLLYKFKSGAARIAIALSAPIVPVGIKYTDSEKTRCDITFGEAVRPEVYHELPYSVLPGRLKAEHLSDIMEERVAKILGQKRAGVFAKLRKYRQD